MTGTHVPTTPQAAPPDHPALAGAKAMVPWLVGIVPFGLVIGVRAGHASIPTAAGWLTGPLVFAGSSQVITIQLLDDGAAPLVAIAAALAVNGRLVLYSATMAPYWRDTPRWFRAVAPAFLVDPSLAVGLDGYRRAGPTAAAHRHYLGGAAALFVAWVTAITVGASLGAALPAGLHLELVVPLYLLGQVVPRVTSRAVRDGVVAAAVLGVLSPDIPLHVGPLAAVAAGAGVSLARERSSE
jgi:predicted branched-subunit amino acid permease